MKRLISITLMVMLLVTISVSALAYTASGTIEADDADGWKAMGNYNKRVATGSFWKATLESSSTASTSKAYLYSKEYDRSTPIEPFSKGVARTGLNYYAGENVTGVYYRLVAFREGQSAVTLNWYYNP